MLYASHTYRSPASVSAALIGAEQVEHISRFSFVDALRMCSFACRSAVCCRKEKQCEERVASVPAKKAPHMLQSKWFECAQQ
jgi:hypothetical protein